MQRDALFWGIPFCHSMGEEHFVPPVRWNKESAAHLLILGMLCFVISYPALQKGVTFRYTLCFQNQGCIFASPTKAPNESIATEYGSVFHVGWHWFPQVKVGLIQLCSKHLLHFIGIFS